MNWKDVRVLVTGAGGFIGSHLAEELARRGARVRALARYNSRSHFGHLEETPRDLARRIDIQLGDITDAYCVSELARSQEVVFHLAALISIPYSYAAPSSYQTVNVGGTLNVLEACRRHRVKRVVHTSTSEVYGTALYTPIDEGHPLQGQSPYSASKIGADHLAESYHRAYGLPVTVVRPFNTYGPRQSARAILPTIAIQLLSEKGLLDLGDLTPVRDFNFVMDTVDGFLAAAGSTKALGRVVNLGSGRGVAIGQAARVLMTLLGRRAPIRKDRKRLRPAQSEVYRLVCDYGRARRLLGWRPRYSLEEGLVPTLEYLRAHLDAYKPSRYNV